MSNEQDNLKKRTLDEVSLTSSLEEDDILNHSRVKKKMNLQRKDCPYLDTVNRNILDFDFEKICSISFNNYNVYACLICGKYFQGKSQDSNANLHCLQTNHHVFINLHNQKIYCLPDDYEVIDSSLDDIKYLLNPIYKKEQLNKLDELTTTSRALDGTQYLTGMVGLNNIKKNSYFNVVIQMLSKIPLLRNYFIDFENNHIFSNSKSTPLISSLSELLRKIWNNRNFKSQVSPHELLQVVQNISKKKFMIGDNNDPLDFLQWLLNTCHLELHGSKDLESSIIYKTFAGEIELTTKSLILPPTTEKDNQQQQQKDQDKKYKTIKSKPSPFLFLSLDLPPKPIFKDEKAKSILPQVSLFTLLEKYDGRENYQANGDIKTYRIKKLPEYLIFAVKRFSMNNFFLEKESTIVNFPLKNLDLSEYLDSNGGNSNDTNNIYNLHSLIKHEGEPDSGLYSVYINHKATDKWFEFQDLVVKETMTQLINVSECYLLIYERVKK